VASQNVIHKNITKKMKRGTGTTKNPKITCQGVPKVARSTLVAITTEYLSVADCDN